MNKYTVKILESKDVLGLTGDNGEKFCIMFRNNKNPLASLWKWVETREAAEEMRELILIELDSDTPYPSPA